MTAPGIEANQKQAKSGFPIWITIGIVAVVAIVFFALFARWRNLDRNLTEKPKRGGSHLQIPSTKSSFQVSAAIPYSTIAAALASKIPPDVSIQGRQNVCADLNEAVSQTVQKVIGGDVGKFLGGALKFVTQVVTVNQLRHVCQDVDYRVNIRRDGLPAASLAPSGHAIRVTVPVSISGEAGFSGDLARALAMDRKSFRGSITGFVDVSGDVGTDWCPVVQATPDFVWRDNAQLEIIHNVWINIDGSAGPKIRDILNDAANKLPSLIDCSKVKTALTPVWHPYSWPISNGKSVFAYVNLTPNAAGFSGLVYEPDQLRLAVELDGTTEVSTTPIKPDALATPLPPLRRLPATSDEINISLPLKGDYRSLEQALQPLLIGKDFTGESPAGTATIRVSRVTLYPAGDSLVVGLQFSAKFSRKLENVAGWVYLVAVPTLDQASQTVRIRNVQFTRDIDNKLWALVSAVFRGNIQGLIEKQAILDLKTPIDALRVRAKADLSKDAKSQGINLTLNDKFVGLQQINMTDEDLEVLVGFRGNADISVGPALMSALH